MRQLIQRRERQYEKENKMEWTPNLSAENQGRKFTPSEIAEIVGTDPKTFRSWMRKQTTVRAGSGNRWSITEYEARKLVYLWDNRKSATVFALGDNAEFDAMFADESPE